MNISKKLFRGTAAAIALGVLLLLQSAAVQAISYVSTTGSDATGDGSTTAPFKSITRGIIDAYEDIPTTATADNANIWALFDASVTWATNSAAPTKAAVVVANQNIYGRTSDKQVVKRLLQKGWNVDIISAELVQQQVYTSTTAGWGLLVISQSVGGSNANLLRGQTTPIINMQPSSWDDWGYVSVVPTVTSTLGTSITLLSTTIGTPGPITITPALGPGNVTVYSRPYSVGFGNVADLVAGVTVAANTSNPARACIWTMPAGTTLSNVSTTNPVAASGNRVVGFFLHSLRAVGGTNYTRDWIDNALQPAASEVRVATGTYTPKHGLATFYNLKISGGWSSDFSTQSTDPNLTILDGESITRLLWIIEDDTATMAYNTNQTAAGLLANPLVTQADFFTIENFKFQNGFGGPYAGSNVPETATGDIYLVGGAIHRTTDVDNVVVRNCIFFNNRARHRGGVIFAMSQNTDNDPGMLFESCLFTSNSVTGFGNANGDGGAVYSDNLGPITRFNACTFDNNDNNGTGEGVIYYRGSTRGNQISSCIFTNNHITTGANNCLVRLNGNESVNRQMYVLNNTFYNNAVGGQILRDENSAGNNTFIQVFNNIFMDNTSAAGGSIFSRQNAATTNSVNLIRNNITFNNTNLAPGFMTNGTFQGRTSTGNFVADPGFVDAPGGDFHLPDLASPAINAGTTLPLAVLTDIDGEERASGAAVDIGADEFQIIIVLNTNARHWEMY